MDFFISIVFQHVVTAPINLFFIFFDPAIHLLLKSVFYCQSQLHAETILDDNQNDEKEYSAAFLFDVFGLKLANLLL